MPISYTQLAYILVPLLIVLFASIKILREYERAVVFTLGRFTGVKGPGFFLVLPVIQQIVTMELRTIVMDIPAQDVISRDNVSVRVSAVVYFRVVNPEHAVIQVENYLEAISQLSQTTLRSVLGQHELDAMLAERNKLNAHIQQILDEQAATWGIKVGMVEIKHIDLNENMIRAIAKQAEAERERRAKIIHADGEMQASQKLYEAAKILAQEPQALQLRYLQTLSNIAEEKNSTIVFPIPIELFSHFQKASK
jgi:regulator of protease activity HflC (stomatin/prohibitin superfamily)